MGYSGRSLSTALPIEIVSISIMSDAGEHLQASVCFAEPCKSSPSTSLFEPYLAWSKVLTLEPHEDSLPTLSLKRG